MAKKKVNTSRIRNRRRTLLLDPLEYRILLSTTYAITGNTADQSVGSTGVFNYVGNTTERIGDNGTNAYEVSYIVPFLLPTGTGVNSASFQIVLNSVANQSSVTGNVDIYGLGFRPFSAVEATDFFEGAYNTDPNSTPIENAIFTHSSTPGTYTTSAAADTALANYLNAQYAAGAQAGDYVFLRLNAESDQATSRYWVVDTADNTGAGLQPVLNITYNSSLPPPDTTPPAITIASPANSALLSGTPPTALTVTGVAGTASGDLPNVTLNVYSGPTATGTPLQTLTTTANSSTGVYSFATSTLPQGQYTIQATQSDNAGNIGTSTTTYSTYNTIAGDANGDGNVNFADFVILSNNFGLTNTNAGPSVGDFNYDHTVNFADFVILSNNFGQLFVPAPSNLTLVTSSASTINLSWTDNATNETAYIVDRSTDGIHFTNVATLPPNTTAWQDTALSADTTYYYHVRATDNGTDSANAAGSDSTIPNFYQTIWVDGTNGSDTNAGTFAAPFKTITAALNSTAVKGHPAGTGIVVRAGTYTESNKSLVMPSGTAGSPFTLMGEPTESVIISGFKQITGWTQYSGSIYSTTLTWNPTTLYVNSTPEAISRSPDSSWWTIPATVTQNGTTSTTISDPANLTGIGNVVGGYMQEYSTAANIPISSQIISQDTVNGTITFAYNSSATAGQFYSLTDALSLINNPGEWASVSNGNGTYTVYFEPHSIADLANTQAQYTTGREIQITNSAHDITIRNLEITGTQGYGVDIEGSQTTLGSDVIVRNSIIDNNGNDGIWIRFETNITVENNTIAANLNGIGIASTTNSLVNANDIGFDDTDGIDLTGDYRGPGSTTGFVPTVNVTISNNYIHDHLGWGHADGIQIFSWVDDATITGNFITRNGQGLMTENVDDDVTNGVADSNWSTLSNNVFLDTGADTVIFGHSNSFNWNVTNNTIGGTGYGPFSFTATGYNVSQNIIFGAESMTSASANQYTGDYNFYYSPVSQYFLATSSPSWVNYNALVTATHTGFYDTQGQDQHSKFSAAGATIGPPPTSPFVNGPAFGTMLSASKFQLCTTTLLYLNSVTGMAVGDYIQIDGDGVARKIIAIDSVNGTITIDTPLSSVPLSPSMLVEDWGTRRNFTLNLAATGVAATMSPTGGAVGSTINVENYITGDYNGDGIRDYPVLPPDVEAGLPDIDGWPVPNFSVIGP